MDDDDALDRRLREYAARWRAGEPAAPAPAGVVEPRRRHVLLPALTAAAVVATVVGVGVARRDDSRQPPASPSASQAPSTEPSAATCADLMWSAGFTRSPDTPVGGDLRGEVRITNPGSRACPLPEVSDIAVRHGVTDIGVPYERPGTDDILRMLAPQTTMAMPLTWKSAAPVCAGVPVVLLIERARDEPVRLPLDPHVFRRCTSPETRSTGTLDGGEWVELPADSPCPIDAFDSEMRLEGVDRPDGDGTSVQLVLELTNRAGRPCDIDVKPMFYIVAGGRRLRLEVFMHSDGREGPPLPVGGRARAQMHWASYCGDPLEDYGVWVEISERPGASEVAVTGFKPVPSKCTQSSPERTDGEGQASVGWLDPA